MTLVPALIPNTIPEDELIVATPVALLLHVPPPLLNRLVLEPIHKVTTPEIAAGMELTVTVVVVIQPLDSW